MLLPLLLNNLMAAQPSVVNPGVTPGGTPGKLTPRLAPWSVAQPQAPLPPSKARRRRELEDELVMLFKP